MTQQQVQTLASRLGLSVWEAEAVRVGPEGSETARIKCIGFATLEFPLVEADEWDEAFTKTLRLIFGS
jgi:hypothetical protein